MKVKLIKYPMPNILSEKNYTLGKWGLRGAFNQNSFMQFFNGDRRIVQSYTIALKIIVSIQLKNTVKLKLSK